MVAKSDVALRRVLADLDAQALPGVFRELLEGLRAHWARLSEALDACSARSADQARKDERCQHLGSVLGIGAIITYAALATVTDPREFRNGREMEAWLGLVPTQQSRIC